MRLAGWGRYPVMEARTAGLFSVDRAAELVRRGPSLIGRGNGRAYGDAAINPALTLLTRPADRLVALDAAAGTLSCEAGVLLADLLPWLAARGWFLPVVPGTKLVTIGGMIASDVHGKNHHRDGAVGAHVVRLRLLTAGGEIIDCGPDDHAPLFAATLGGMGLTGVILGAVLRLIPIDTPYILQQTHRFPDLATVCDGLTHYSDWPYSVAWIDTLARGSALGRSVLFLGRHARRDDAPPPPRPARAWRLSVPIDAPAVALNRWTVGAFNALYYAAARPGVCLRHYDGFFFPLDGIGNWNRIYGRRGFMQYQCVLPEDRGRAGLERLLHLIAESGLGSFLAVLKRLGPEGGPLGFALPGYTLALDFPVKSRSFALMTRLDRVVRDHGGRLYLTKDARMSREMLESGYPRLAAFQDLRARIDPDRRFQSALSRRLDL